MSIQQRPHSGPSGRFFWTAFVFGWAIISFGLLLMLRNVKLTNPGYSVGLAFTFNVFHDAVIAPAACAVGYAVTRLAPHRIRAQISWGLFASAIVVVIGFVPLSGRGKKPDNPSVLPLDYVTSTATALAAVWLIVLVLVLATELKRRRVMPAKQSNR